VKLYVGGTFDGIAEVKEAKEQLKEELTEVRENLDSIDNLLANAIKKLEERR